MTRSDQLEFVGPSPELLALGTHLDAMLEEILGRPCRFALAIALDNKPTMTIRRLSNSSISDARTLFEIAALVPVSLDTYEINGWPAREAN